MSLKDVLIDEMRDLYSAENQIVKAIADRGHGKTALPGIASQHFMRTLERG